MSPLQRVAFVGNHLPRRCGIATFTHDLHRAVSLDRLDLETGVVAMTDADRTYDYPTAVRLQIHDEAIGEYDGRSSFASLDVASEPEHLTKGQPTLTGEAAINDRAPQSQHINPGIGAPC